MIAHFVTAPERIFINGLRPVLVCLLCPNVIIPGEAVLMPWGSDFYNDLICPDCAHKHIDPLLARLLAERKEDESLQE